MPSSLTPLFHSDPDDGENSALASDRIRTRLQHANRRFHANDNISAFVKEGEIDQLRDEVAAKMAEVLKSLVIDTDNDHNTNETAQRIAKMYLTEICSGRSTAHPTATVFPNLESVN